MNAESNEENDVDEDDDIDIEVDTETKEFSEIDKLRFKLYKMLYKP